MLCPQLLLLVFCHLAMGALRGTTCIVGDWEMWSECTQSCGGNGIQTRTRPIVEQGVDCPNTQESRPCGTQHCETQCVMQQWGKWGVCSKTCGTGIKRRVRTILKGGFDCPTFTAEEAPCELRTCEIHCELDDWTRWTPCDKTCGGGKRTRTRVVRVQPPPGARACPSTNEVMACNTQACPKTPVSVNQGDELLQLQGAKGQCKFSAWTSWTNCTQECGGGLRTRTRKITQTGFDCPVTIQSRRCNVDPCEGKCTVGAWGSWGRCSQTCGNGSQMRNRTVINNGTDCPHTTESRLCDLRPCTGPCIMGAWSAWGPCSMTCGMGQQMRTRKVKESPTSCPETASFRSCYTPCPMPCVMSKWGSWSACPVTCGGGSRSRTRTIIEAPINGGSCNVTVGTMPCNTDPCN
eukprot:NODE_49_length_1989_cov_422.059613_g48_i0.p1 GENE.NODE_49_length_1989_cov_422.059613_g48_i0~~NODE_49_length_1989_cov_422.059613_g48_i0.p1  ORF type:complete len:406 (-),score=54.18 NODE_49_length_1989_cov_422.059613_g48_i0:672-1889(-)